MPENNFALAKDSIQMPYRRFLSDSAAGFVLLLLSLAAYYLPVFGEPLSGCTFACSALNSALARSIAMVSIVS